MWQDQRGTDHSFEIMARDESAFMTFVERHGIPPIGSGLSLGHILHCRLDRPDVHARTAAYVEAMDYVTARLTGRITASSTARSWSSCATTARSAPTAYDDELVKLARRRRDPAPPLVADRRRDRHAAARRSRDELGLPASATVYAGTNDTATVAVATGAFAPGPRPASRSARRACSSTRSPTSASTSSTRSSRCPARTPTATSCARRTGSAARCSNTCCATSCTPPTSSATTASTIRSRRSTRRSRATDAGRGRRACSCPWLGGSRAPQGSGAIRGGFVNMSLETNRRDLVRAVVEGVAHNLRLAAPARRGVHRRTRSRRSRSSAARPGRAAVVPGARRRARPAGHRARRARRRGRARDRAARARSAPARSPRRPRPRTASRRVAASNPTPRHRSLYADRQVQFEAAYAALLPISEALS